MYLVKVSALEFKSLDFQFNPLSIALGYLGKAEQKKKKKRIEKQVVQLDYEIPQE